MPKRMTNEEFLKKFYAQVGDEYTPLSKYIKSRIKITVRHNKCGHIYEIKPSSFLIGNRCPLCASKMTMTDKEFKIKVKKQVGNEYSFLDEYINTNTKIRVRHNVCNYIYLVKPQVFLRRNRCPLCAKNKRTKSNSTFKKEVKHLTGDEYIFLEKYVTNGIKIKVKHHTCNNIYKVSPSHFLNGSRCPYCSIQDMVMTNEEFKRRVQEQVNDEYVFLDKYVKYNIKLRVYHKKCKHVYFITPADFLSGHRCFYCFIQNNRKKYTKSDLQFKQEVKKKHNGNYTVLDNYINNHTKIRFKHNICGYIYEATPNTFLKHNCPKCAINIRSQKHTMTNDKFKRIVKFEVGNEYTFLENYIKSKIKIKVRHNKCGRIYNVTPSDFISGNRCRICTLNRLTKKQTMNENDFLLRIQELVGDEYIFLENYINSQTPILVKHNICTNVYKVSPNNFYRGKRCPKCYSKSRFKTNIKFVKEVKRQVGNEYIFLNKYIDNKTKLLVKHNKCGRIYKVRPNSFLNNGNRCSQCTLAEKSSRGERKIREWLDYYGYSYIHGYRLKGLIDKEPLHLDFYLEKEKIAIEYDGEQHFKPVKYMGGVYAYLVRQKHDKMKNKYLSKKEIRLIRIKYGEDINNILNYELRY